jgi:hypothetical protein
MAEDEVAATASGFDKAKAVELGLLVQAAYTMYKEGGQTPSPTGISPAYAFVAWVQMQDFSIGSSEFQFYGVVVQEVAHPGHYVVAIRGTQSDIEWFDDATAAVPVSWPSGGNVGFGFNKIYGTLRIVDPQAAENRMGARFAETSGSFAEQVGRVTERHHMATAKEGTPAPVTVSAVGHSLGSALATLYVSDNHRTRFKNVSLLCTFASPFVGDAAFAKSFDNLGIISWRVVNSRDLVPQLPPIEYQHVEVAETYDSGNETVIDLLDLKLTVGCWHSLQTYLHLLDSGQAIETACLPRSTIFGARRMALAQQPKQDVSVSVPRDGLTTINITINVDGSS